jgi:hypothetical protein
MVEAKSKTTRISYIDGSDQIFSRICSHSRQIAALLTPDRAVADLALSAALDDLLGALYALTFAKAAGFEHRVDRPIEVSAVQKRARQVGKGEIRVDGKWMAGFHFNSALYRISATYHRTLKFVVGNEGDVGDLRIKAERLYNNWKGKKWKNENLRSIHSQVNDLKHSKQGIYTARRKGAGLDNAIGAVDELLELVEAWSDNVNPVPSAL